MFGARRARSNMEKFRRYYDHQGVNASFDDDTSVEASRFSLNKHGDLDNFGRKRLSRSSPASARRLKRSCHDTCRWTSSRALSHRCPGSDSRMIVHERQEKKRERWVNIVRRACVSSLFRSKVHPPELFRQFRPGGHYGKTEAR